ncbi:MAG: AarF/ABC1/UbiB kinase family protein, partial [Solirubrobacteraceae bacterium]|nr:AarF/ABC1/UbiB kinase family protein [Solirubrobacteraceae bacterium]
MPIPRSRFSRTAKFGGMVAGQSAKWAGTRVANQFRGDEQADAKTHARAMSAAEQIVEQLGSMKGAAMKIGQVLSTIDFDLIPEESRPEFKEKLAALRDQSERVPFADLRKMIDEDFDGRTDEFFEEIEPEAIAAASIGQVHRGRTTDGKVVAIKIQYPGIAEAVSTDLRNASLLTPLIRSMAPGLDVKALMGELTERIEEEVDYELESQRHRQIERALRGHPDIRVPTVDTRRSTRRVLTTEFVDARTFDDVRKNGDLAERSRFGELIFRFFYGVLMNEHTALGDPHPGNLMYDSDNRLVALDFGLLRHMSPAYLEGERVLGQAIKERDAAQVHASMAHLGYLPKPDEFDKDLLLRQMIAATDWYMGPEGETTIDAELVRKTLEQTGSPRSEFFSMMRRQTVPPEALLLRRMEGLVFSVLGELGARANWGAIAAEYLQGDPPSTPLGEIDAAHWATRP